MSEVVVLQSFVGNLDGADLHFKAGDRFPADHKAAKKWPHLFGPAQPALEQATAAPGEKRAVRLGRSQPKAEADPAPAGKAISTTSFEAK